MSSTFTVFLKLVKVQQYGEPVGHLGRGDAGRRTGANPCPVASPKYEETATRLMLAAFSMISMDISTMMVLLQYDPAAPMNEQDRDMINTNSSGNHSYILLLSDETLRPMMTEKSNRPSSVRPLRSR